MQLLLLKQEIASGRVIHFVVLQAVNHIRSGVPELFHFLHKVIVNEELLFFNCGDLGLSLEEEALHLLELRLALKLILFHQFGLCFFVRVL